MPWWLSSFVEINAFDIDAMNPGLGFADALKNGERILFHLVAESRICRRAGNKVANFNLLSEGLIFLRIRDNRGCASILSASSKNCSSRAAPPSTGGPE